MENKKGLLPQGSIVILKGAVKKIMIITRGNIVKDKYFDYGAVLYPEGMIDENVAYFNQEDIMKIVFEGHSDEEDKLFLNALSDAYVKYEAGELTANTEVALGEFGFELPTQANDTDSSEKEIADPFDQFRDME
jgi:hypothetical protein